MKPQKHVLGANFFFYAKVVLEYFGTTWGVNILNRSSTKNYRAADRSQPHGAAGSSFFLQCKANPAMQQHKHSTQVWAGLWAATPSYHIIATPDSALDQQAH
jgi:hypothetical protein